jgi:RNA polymerase sigma factor (sigma-70 family)
MATGPDNSVLTYLRQMALRRESAGLSDGELLERFRSGRDAAAFEALLRRHGPMVLAVCRRLLPNNADAEDAFQATFLVLLRKGGSIDPPQMVGNFLYGVAYHTARRTRAEIARRHVKENEARAMARPVSEEKVEEQLLALLDEELHSLPDKYRLTIVLCELEGKTRKEAAQQLGCAEGTIASRLARARKMLAHRLARRGLVLSVGGLAAALSGQAASACLSPLLMVSTIKAVTRVAAGDVASLAFSAKSAALAEGVVKSMFLSNLKWANVCILMMTLLVTGVSGFVYRSLAVEQAPPPLTSGAVKPAKPTPHPPQGPPQAPLVVRQDAILQRMAMSPAGDVVATVGVTHDGSRFNNTVKLWDVRTGKLKRTLDEEKGGHLEIAFSRDLLAIGVNGRLYDTNARGPREVRLLDAKTLGLKHKIDSTVVPGLSSLQGLAFSPDGKLLALAGLSERAFVKLWDVEKQKLLEGKTVLGEIPRDLNTHQLNSVVCLAFSPDGKLVAAAWSDGKIRLFNGQTGDFRTLLGTERQRPKFSGVGGIAFSPDSKTLASKGDDNTVVLWDLSEGKPRQTLRGHKGGVTAVAYSRDGRWIATGGRTAKENDCEVLLWDAKNGELKHTFSGLTEWVHVVAFSPDGKILAVCAGAGRGVGKETKTTGELWLFPLEYLTKKQKPSANRP